MIRYENPTGFPVYSNVVFLSIFVLAFSARKGEVDGKALEWLRSFASGVYTSRFFCLFGPDTNRTFVKNRVMVFKLGNTINKFVCSIEAFIRWMAKSLVPKESFSLSTNGIDGRGI